MCQWSQKDAQLLTVLNQHNKPCQIANCRPCPGNRIRLPGCAVLAHRFRCFDKLTLLWMSVSFCRFGRHCFVALALNGQFKKARKSNLESCHCLIVKQTRFLRAKLPHFIVHLGRHYHHRCLGHIDWFPRRRITCGRWWRWWRSKVEALTRSPTQLDIVKGNVRAIVLLNGG